MKLSQVRNAKLLAEKQENTLVPQFQIHRAHKISHVIRKKLRYRLFCDCIYSGV